jgi:hypothetical protein
MISENPVTVNVGTIYRELVRLETIGYIMVNSSYF